MSFLEPDERRTLALLCETLAPALAADPGDDPRLFSRSASDFNVTETVEQALAYASTPAMRLQLRLFLAVLEIDLFNRLTTGQPGAFSAMTLERRTSVLRAWANSRFFPARKAFQVIKRLTLFLFYSTMPDNQPNPVWPVIGYELPAPPTPAPRPIQPLQITSETVLHTDVLVIGSGAGGGVIAGELTEAGLDVIVAEKGEYWADSDFHGREQESTARLFEKQGLLTTEDFSMNILAGSVLGGGTTINWAASFRTPDHVLDEWARDYGFHAAVGEAYGRSLDTVMQRLYVNGDTLPNQMNCILENGSRALGQHIDIIQRNANGCGECGFCNFGCAQGGKQGVLRNYLQDACTRGARILTGAHVERVLVKHGKATGASITVMHGDKRIPVTVKARAVVSSAGSLHTPALFRRSGLTNSSIGANLHLHPVGAIYGVFENPVRGWQGAPMTRYNGEFANMDGRGYGVRLQTAPIHPGIAALSLSWESGRQHKQTMQQLANLSNIIVITRDRDSGRVEMDKNGQPVIHYSVSQRDRRHLMRGILAALRIMHAAGALEVASPHNRRIVFSPSTPGSMTDTNGRSFDDFLREVEAAGLHGNAYALFSAHQLSSCRIGANTALGALSPEGESYEVRGLYAADGSVLPTATGVNPMISIMGAAHYLAQGIKARLNT